jgi:hypothetical protein
MLLLETINVALRTPITAFLAGSESDGWLSPQRSSYSTAGLEPVHSTEVDSTHTVAKATAKFCKFRAYHLKIC